MNYLLYSAVFFQISVFFLGLARYRRFQKRNMFLLIMIFFLSAFTEVIGVLKLGHFIGDVNVHFFYTGFLFNLICFFYTRLIDNKLSLSLMTVQTILFTLFWLYVFNKPDLFHYVIILGSFNTSVFIFLYLRQLLLSNEIMNYKKLLPFWVSVGFFIFYLPSIPFFTLLDYMKNRGLFFILHLLIILMNLFIIYGLLCSKKEEKY